MLVGSSMSTLDLFPYIGLMAKVKNEIKEPNVHF